MIPNGIFRATVLLTSAVQPVCRLVTEDTMIDPRTLLLAVLVAILTGCAAGPQPSALEWLETEYLKDPTRR